MLPRNPTAVNLGLMAKRLPELRILKTEMALVVVPNGLKWSKRKPKVNRD